MNARVIIVASSLALACGDAGAGGESSFNGGASAGGESSFNGGAGAGGESPFNGGAGAAGESSFNGGVGAGGAGSTGLGGAGGVSGVGGSGGAELPDGLVTYVTGDPADAVVTPTGPALLLMGGGTDVDAAFAAWVPLIQGGDVVVLRTSGADGYNDYLHSEVGGTNSVETMLVTSQTLANSDYVAERLANAEAIFMAGGDQATYVTAWKGTRVETEIEAAYARGAVIGGTSAGCAVLGDFAFAALEDTVYSDEALEDPYNPYMTMEHELLDLPPLVHVITDTHFAERDRMGRLVGFVARTIQDGWADETLGIGVDEATALFVDASGVGTVMGEGSVYVVRSNGVPATCAPGATLEYQGLELVELIAGQTVNLPNGDSSVASTPLAASDGVTVPAAPY